MSRDLSSANATALDGVVIRPVVFTQLEFDSPTGTLYLHDDIGPITADDWGGVSRTWDGVGDFGGISQLDEGRDVSPYKVELMLSGIDADIAAQVLTDDSVLRNVYILVCLLDDDRALVDDPHPMWAGKVDDLQVAIGTESVIKIVCESQLAAFEKINGRLQNDADHQAEFAGDKFFEYLPQMLDAKFRWGGRTQTFRAGSASALPGMANAFRGEIPYLR
jgi:hypothetical protein